jgi:DNA-binding transcriptional LysR family regulator
MLDELHHFLLICEHGTFTAASRRAHLSQPALTASIQRLEEQLGARLLDRGPSGARPTTAGTALKPWAEAALAAVARGRRAVADVEGLAVGEVRIGAGSTACSFLLPPLLTAFRAAHPGIQLFLRELPNKVVRRRVQAGELDLGIVSDPEGAEPWWEEDLILVASPELQPQGAPHLTFPVGANHRELLEAHFPGVPIAMELNSLVAVKAHVAAGMGVALLSTTSVAAELAEGRLVQVDDPHTPLHRTLYLLHLGLPRLSPAARALRGALMGPTPAPR